MKVKSVMPPAGGINNAPAATSVGGANYKDNSA
jgi:hypothetical protein